MVDVKNEAILSSALQQRMSKEFGEAVTDFGVSYKERADIGHGADDAKE